MALYVLRHQESEGNLKGIIQGGNYNPSLTIQGRKNAEFMASELYNLLNNHPVKILASPLSRALESAQIIADKFNLSVITNQLLTEFNPGILAGLTKEDAKNMHPEYLKIWNNREDLDGIPGAEKGEVLQARALCFLEDYMNSPDYDLILVSHAGFNRSLINTIKGQKRTTAINPSPDAIYIINNPWENIVLERQRALNSETYKIKTFEQDYVLRKSFKTNDEAMQFQYNLSTHVVKYGDLLPKILFFSKKNNYFVQVSNYYEGRHISNQLSDTQRNNLLNGAYKLGLALESAPADLVNSCAKNFRDKLKNTISSLESSFIKEKGEALLNNSRYLHLTEVDKQVLIHYDLHDANFIFNSNDEVRFLDMESIFLGPRNLIPGSLFTSYFLLGNFAEFNIDNLLNAWPEKLNKKDVLLLMQAKALAGGAYFQKEASLIKSYQKEEKELLDKYNFAVNYLDVLLSKEE